MSRSPRFRYLKARLSILARPSFIAGLVFLAAMGFVIKEYWTNPNFLKFSQNQQAPSPDLPSSSSQNLSDEDKAIAADIDNLSILNYDQRKAKIPLTTGINSANTIKQENEAQLKKILDLAKKNQQEKQSQPDTESQTAKIPSPYQQNPFLKQAEDLLQFNFDNNKDSSANNLSPFNSALQTPQSSFNLGINNNSASQNNNNESALKKAIEAIDRSNANTNNPAVTNPNITSNPTNKTDKNNFGQLPKTPDVSSFDASPNNQGLSQNQTNTLVDTTIFNQPLNQQNNQSQPYGNFYNNQLPTNNYSQPNLNNQSQPYSNFNNQLPNNNYAQPGLNNPIQNYDSNFNNTQLPGNNYSQPNYNNNNQLQNNQQNPYSNFNNNQLPTNTYNQPNLNNRGQNPYGNFNNTQITGNRYSPSTVRKVNDIYSKLINRDNPTVNTPNNYNLPNNNTNIGIQQPNVQQFNSPYSQQNPAQYPNNVYRY